LADGLIATWKEPVKTLAGTVTAAGTVAMDVLLLASEMIAPPVGVKELNVSMADVLTVPVWTNAGLSEMESRTAPGGICGAGVTVIVAVLVIPL